MDISTKTLAASGERKAFFFLNFVILDFCKHEIYVDFEDPGKLFILNLVTRKQFWIEKQTIENQIKAKAPDVSEKGVLILEYGNENHMINKSYVYYMGTNETRILIEYRIHVGLWEDDSFTGALVVFDITASHGS